MAIACLSAIAGCGGSAGDQFTSRYFAAQAPLNETFADLATASTHTGGKTSAEIARSLGRLATRFTTELSALEALRPPARAAAAFRTLTASLNRVKGDLWATYVAFGHGDLVSGPQAIVSLQTDTRAATAAAAAVAHMLKP
ncbi:MAG TPA: hypothetical protein VG186_08015 [Solirubrobacteraceae bacterium]|nr:hypothetical protein [Solirubrobacteraceae bacterium]